jgi:hypothetical protein
VTHVSCKIIIDALAFSVWQVIGDFGSAGQYLALVVICKVEGAGVGALRALTNTDGSVILERLETLDETAHSLSYALLSDTPFGGRRLLV